eukprot:9254934-Alexandrium_andersonii.AAC.1
MLFGYKAAKRLHTKLLELINDETKKFLQGQITIDRANTFRTELLAKAEALPRLMPHRRLVDVTYRGKTFAWKVNSVSQQIMISVASAWK